MPTLDRRLVAILAAGVVCAAGCGDDDDGGGESASGGGAAENGGGAYGGGNAGGGGGAEGGGAQRLELSADPDGALKFDKSSLTAKAGKVTIVMDNPSSLPHAVEVEGNGVEEVGETVEEGGVSRVSADVEPGEYEYYCPVGGHEAAGMKGTLTVE